MAATQAPTRAARRGHHLQAGLAARPHPPKFDPVTQAWALVGPGNRFVGYDDPRAVRAKRELAAREGLAGLFAWELSQDDGRILDAMQPAAK